MIKLTQNEVDNLLDVLDEWYNCETLGVKELEENEIGLNDDRYKALIKKLKYDWTYNRVYRCSNNTLLLHLT